MNGSVPMAWLRGKVFDWAAIGILCFSSGCVHYTPQPLALEQTAALLDNRSLNDPKLKAFIEQRRKALPQWPLAAWDFESLALAALFYHPALEIARAQWQQATGGIDTAKARPNPVLSLVPGYDFTPAQGVTPWLPAAGIDIPIETMGKRRHRISHAQYLAEAAQLNLTVAAWDVRSRLRAALIDLRAAEARQSLQQRQAEAQQAVVTLLEERFKAGSISMPELHVARLALIKLRADLAESARQTAEARSRLAPALGVSAAALNGMVLDFPLEAIPTLPDATKLQQRRNRALQQRADILQALALYQASEAALELEIARQYPDLHLGNTYQWDQGESKWTFAINLELPILNRNQGPIREAEAKRHETAAQVLALQSKVIAEIDQAIVIQKTTDEQLLELRNARRGAQEQMRALESRFAAGAADRLELQSARLELETSELAVLNAQVKAIQVAGQLEDALQETLDWPAKGNGSADQKTDL